MKHTLVNSRFVNVVPRVRIQDTLQLMKQPLDARVDAPLGREICLRDGGKMMSRLNGIFAFAIHDSRDVSLLLVRDGLGVKPFYFAETHKGVLFASEIKALLQEPSIERSLNH